MTEQNMEKKEMPLLIFQKKADVNTSRIIIPKFFVNKYGLYYRMEIYEDKIILIPNKKEK